MSQDIRTTSPKTHAVPFLGPEGGGVLLVCETRVSAQGFQARAWDAEAASKFCRDLL